MAGVATVPAPSTPACGVGSVVAPCDPGPGVGETQWLGWKAQIGSPMAVCVGAGVGVGAAARVGDDATAISSAAGTVSTVRPSVRLRISFPPGAASGGSVALSGRERHSHSSEVDLDDR